MHYVTGTLAAIALIAIAVFSLQNLGAVEIYFLTGSITISKWLVILGSYILGMISGWGLVDLIRKAFQRPVGSEK